MSALTTEAPVQSPAGKGPEIAPVTLVTGDPAAAPTPPLIPRSTLVGALIVVVVAVGLVCRAWRRRDAGDPCETAFRRLSRRLRLASSERALLRVLAGVPVPTVEAASATVEAPSTSAGAARPTRQARAPAPRFQVSEEAVRPVALLLSEQAFLQRAGAWLSSRPRQDRAEALVVLQHKIFAPRR